MDIVDSNMKAHRAWCQERGTESDTSGKEPSRRSHSWDMGEPAVPGEGNSLSKGREIGACHIDWSQEGLQREAGNGGQGSGSGEAGSGVCLWPRLQLWVRDCGWAARRASGGR